MTVRVTNNQIVVTDTAGEVKFNSDDPMFFATDFKTGSVSIPLRDQSVYQLTEFVYDLGPVNAIASRVVGVFRVDFGPVIESYDTPGYGWFNAGGTYMHYGRGNLQFLDPPFYLTNTFFETCALYTFRISAGRLQLFEQVQVSNKTTSGFYAFFLRPFVLHYRLWCGRFDL